MDPNQSSRAPQVLPAARPLVSIQAFHAIVWTGFSICILAFCLRIYIRWLSFRRLLADDYLMTFALVCMAGTAATGQMVLQNIYNLIGVESGDYTPGPDFLQETHRGLIGFGVQSALCYAGLWIIKFSFLIFFYRLGHLITAYLIFWWIVLLVNIGGLAAVVGVMQFKCMFGPIDHIMTVCNTAESMQNTFDTYVVSICVDCVTDALILSFPVAILWGVPISLRRKLILSAVFCLVAFTIAVTIIRGSIFGGVFKSIREDNLEAPNITWIWFWFNIEFIVSFLVACLVSFRALFASGPSRPAPPTPRGPKANLHSPGNNRGLSARIRRFHNSLLDTLMTFEGSDNAMSLLPHPPNATLTVDFSTGETTEEWTKSGSGPTSDNRSVSARSLGAV